MTCTTTSALYEAGPRYDDAVFIVWMKLARCTAYACTPGDFT